jgi:hypothetical protein
MKFTAEDFAPLFSILESAHGLAWVEATCRLVADTANARLEAMLKDAPVVYKVYCCNGGCSGHEVWDVDSSCAIDGSHQARIVMIEPIENV